MGCSISWSFSESSVDGLMSDTSILHSSLKLFLFVIGCPSWLKALADVDNLEKCTWQLVDGLLSCLAAIANSFCLLWRETLAISGSLKKSSVFDRLGSDSSASGNSPKLSSPGDTSVFSRLGGKAGQKRAATSSSPGWCIIGVWLRFHKFWWG